MENEKKRFIELLLIIFLLILIGIGIVRLIPYSWLIKFSPFGILNMGILDFCTLIVVVLIFLKTFYLGIKYKNPSMIILSSGFFSGALIYLQAHPAFFSFCYEIFKIYPPQFSPILAELSWAMMTFWAVVLIKKTNVSGFWQKCFGLMFLFAVFLSITDRIMSFYFIDYSYKVLPNVVFLNITIQTLYILASYSFMESTKAKQAEIFSIFNLGLLWLGIMPLFIFPLFGTTLYSIFIPLIRIFGLSFLFFGCRDIESKSDYISFRQEFTVYLVLFLIISYIVLIFMSSVFLGVKLPLFAQYAFFIFFMLVIIMQYVISGRFIKQIDNITQVVNIFTPGKKIPSIKISSKNEIGQLAIKINNIVDLNWDYQQKLIAQGKREQTLKNITQIIRSSLDIDETVHNICIEIAKLFNVQRVSIVEYPNKQDYGYHIIKYQYKTREDIIGITQSSPELSKAYAKALFSSKERLLAIDNIQNADLDNVLKNFYLTIGVKSLITTTIEENGKLWGSIVISEYDRYRSWSLEEKELLKAILNQINLAIRQAELYEFQKQTAKNETILRSIISEVKLTKDLKAAYRKLLENLSKVFEVERVLFLESSQTNTEDINIKYEYLKESKSLIEQDLPFPKACIEEFLKLVKNLKMYIINDISKCPPVLYSDYFEKYKIKALLAVPFVKVNRVNRVLGFLVLCSSKKREWTSQETKLLKSISDSIVSVIWEISSFIEIEELRNTFISTLAHDFQIPLIAERNALEVLAKKSDNNKDIIIEIIESNKNLITLLNRFVDIYNYESGKKELTLIKTNIRTLIFSQLNAREEEFKKKSLSVVLDFPEKHFNVDLDISEFQRVLCTLFLNAIEHSPENEKIILKIYKRAERIIFYLKNFGSAMADEIKNKVFRRYEMALKLERKIGAGTGLFLAQKIVEAHKGYIWIETDDNVGTAFYISLPESSLDKE